MEESDTAMLQWIASFPSISVPHQTVEELSDGVALFEIMATIAPDFFDLSKIKRATGDNWRLKATNLRKLLDNILEFYQEELLQSVDGFQNIDIQAIAQYESSSELLKLVKLVLGSAIFCQNKQVYIGAIMQLEQSTQVALMAIIQDIMSKSKRVSDAFSNVPHDVDSFLEKDGSQETSDLRNQYRALSLEKEEITRQFEVLSKENNSLKLQQENLERENEDLLTKLNRLENKSDSSNALVSGAVLQQFKTENERLKIELEESERHRSDLENKIKIHEQTILETRKDIEVMSRESAEYRSLRDEIDVLRHNSEKLQKLESAIETYKKRLEEFADMKRQMKFLEDQNNTYLQTNLDLEEELRKTSSLRGQLDGYKQKVTSLEEELLEATVKVNAAQFEVEKMKQIVDESSAEKIRLQNRLEVLEEQVQDLQQGTSMANLGQSLESGSFGGIGEMAALKEKIMRLERDNKRLLTASSGSISADQDSEKSLLLQEFLNDANLMKSKLEKELIESKQRIHALESETEQLRSQIGSLGAVKMTETLKSNETSLAFSQLAQSEKALRDQKIEYERLHLEFKETKGKLSSLELVLEESQKELFALRKDYSIVSKDKEDMITQLRQDAKDLYESRVKEAELEMIRLQDELKEISVKYDTVKQEYDALLVVNQENVVKKTQQLEQINELLKEKNEQLEKISKLEGYLTRSKQIIVTLQAKSKDGAVSIEDGSHIDAIQALKNQILEKEQEIQYMKREREEAKESHKREERLIISAWYELGLQYHRKATNDRFSATDNGRSWLGRQRQKLGGAAQ